MAIWWHWDGTVQCVSLCYWDVDEAWDLPEVKVQHTTRIPTHIVYLACCQCVQVFWSSLYDPCAVCKQGTSSTTIPYLTTQALAQHYTSLCACICGSSVCANHGQYCHVMGPNDKPCDTGLGVSVASRSPLLTSLPWVPPVAPGSSWHTEPPVSFHPTALWWLPASLRTKQWAAQRQIIM